jgi:glucosamine--fructose-6-phosphate aminotransferase (isomerizing)
MLSEIREQPAALRRTLDQTGNAVKRIAEKNARNVRMIYFTGSGTSYHACIAANYMVSSVTDYLSSTLPASEFSAWTGRTKHQSGTWLIAISQSGESRDVIDAVRSAKLSRMRVLAVTNDAQSRLAKLADFSIASQAGKEEAVTATKSFTATLLATYEFITALTKRDELETELQELPNLVDETLRSCEKKCRKLASKFRNREFFFLLGSGANYASALEGALKLKESCNLYAEGFATREFLHGPMQLVDRRTPIFILQREFSDELSELTDRFKRLGAPTIIVGPHTAVSESDTIEIAGGVNEMFQPLTYVIPLQLFAYYSSISRGLNPDQPTKLKKVVR